MGGGARAAGDSGGVPAIDRAAGRTHVTPVAALWLDDALCFSTGLTERKARNLAHNSHCVITTGSHTLEGLGLVVEGDAVRVTDETRLQRLADAYAAKYDRLFRFTVRDGAFYEEGSESEILVYELAPRQPLTALLQLVRSHGPPLVC